jgi:hypothetical protein
VSVAAERQPLQSEPGRGEEQWEDQGWIGPAMEDDSDNFLAPTPPDSSQRCHSAAP